MPLAMGKRGFHMFSRPLRYRNEEVKLPDGSTATVSVAREKGVDVGHAHCDIRACTPWRAPIRHGIRVSLCDMNDTPIPEPVDSPGVHSAWITVMFVAGNLASGAPLSLPLVIAIWLEPPPHLVEVLPGSLRVGRCVVDLHKEADIASRCGVECRRCRDDCM